MSAGSKLPEGLKQRIAVSAGQFGRLTASRRMLPSFLIVGGQRCGTTSMYKALTQHPAVLSAVLRKGIHYFDVAYDHDLKWYQAHFPLRSTAKRATYQSATAITGESSPYYMFHPLTAERIAQDLPGIKTIVLVRDPVERAYSAHAHELARDFETEADFEKALALEPERLDGQEQWLRDNPTSRSFSHQHHGYLTRGRYVDYLDRLAQHLGRDNVHVVDSDDFFTKPAETYDGVVKFLGLPAAPRPPFEQHNSRSRAPMSEELRARLTAEFEPYDEQLAKWLGWTPSWRR